MHSERWQWPEHPDQTIAGLIVLAVVYLIAVDSVKVRIFRYAGLV